MSEYQDADAIKTLRGHIEWRHPADPPEVDPIVGWFRADQDIWQQWHVLWTPHAINGLGGMSWTRTVGNFKALDEAAKQILAFVHDRIREEQGAL